MKSKNVDYRSLAVEVLKLAAGMDHRFAARRDDLPSMTTAWSAVFDGKVWPDEAMAAVIEHYSRANAFPIMPGDVVAFCEKQPVWSSREHATDFVRSMRPHPHNPLIEHYSGMRPPEPAEYEAWIDANEQEIVTMTVVTKKRPPVS